jgi:cell division protein FtsW
MMFCGRVPLKFLAGTIGAGLLVILLLIPICETFPKLLPRYETWKKRVMTFTAKDTTVNPDDTYQEDCSKTAISFGGLLGMGPGKSIQRNYMPQSSSDYIYSIIIEEYGSLTGSFIILLYLILLFRGLKTASKSKTLFGTFLSYGISFSLVFQALINMAVAVGLMPVTGQTLPLLSMGGTSLWFTSISIGIILSVSKDIEPQSTEDKVQEGLSYA